MGLAKQNSVWMRARDEKRRSILDDPIDLRMTPESYQPSMPTPANSSSGPAATSYPPRVRNELPSELVGSAAERDRAAADRDRARAERTRSRIHPGNRAKPEKKWDDIFLSRDQRIEREKRVLGPEGGYETRRKREEAFQGNPENKPRLQQADAMTQQELANKIAASPYSRGTVSLRNADGSIASAESVNKSPSFEPPKIATNPTDNLPKFDPVSGGYAPVESAFGPAKEALAFDVPSAANVFKPNPNDALTARQRATKSFNDSQAEIRKGQDIMSARHLFGGGKKKNLVAAR